MDQDRAAPTGRVQRVPSDRRRALQQPGELRDAIDEVALRAPGGVKFLAVVRNDGRDASGFHADEKVWCRIDPADVVILGSGPV